LVHDAVPVDHVDLEGGVDHRRHHVLPVVAQGQTLLDQQASLARPGVEQDVVAPGEGGDGDAEVVLDQRRVPAATDQDRRAHLLLVARAEGHALVENLHLQAERRRASRD
jgi:hypothetical protein